MNTPGTEAQEEALRRYAGLLASCVSVRLTGTRDEEELYERHVKDCLESVPLLPRAGRAVDVGSGGGLPGIVWAICRPDLEVTLVDSVGKKCRAAGDIAAALGLDNVRVVQGRSEDLARSERESFDLACARAVASAPVTAELLAPLVRVGGRLLTFKGPKVTEELSEVQPSRWRRLGLRAPAALPYAGSLCLLTWEKTTPCPKTYPRRPGAAGTRGWWL